MSCDFHEQVAILWWPQTDAIDAMPQEEEEVRAVLVQNRKTRLPTLPPPQKQVTFFSVVVQAEHRFRMSAYHVGSPVAAP